MTELSDNQWMVSVDDHLIEPPYLWLDRLPSKYQDRAPKVIRDDGGEAWIYEGRRSPTGGLMSIAGRPKDEWSPKPIRYDEMRSACYDAHERVKDMDEAGVLAQANFPTFPRFCGQIFNEAEDKEFALLCLQAWNDFILDEWCGAAPGRFIPLIIVPLWDPKLAALEVERTVAKGAKGIIFTENAHDLGLPSIHDARRHWDPLWTVVNETEMPISIHIGSSSKLPRTSPDAPPLISVALTPLNSIRTMCDWIFSGLFFRFPNLKLVLSEGEVGWMPFVLEWLDHSAETQQWAWTGDLEDALSGSPNFSQSNFDLTRDAVYVDPDILPSELFRRHVFGCMIEDHVGIRNLDLIGEDNVMMETDYPHSDGSWPDSISVATKQIGHLPPATQSKLLYGNACSVYKFEPASPPF
jgi:predicted TIM-barrel fold metal-dependent hydrolase